jgi:hypothetical protein
MKIRAKSMKVDSTFIVNFALTPWSEGTIQLKGGFTFQHLALSCLEKYRLHPEQACASKPCRRAPDGYRHPHTALLPVSGAPVADSPGPSA